MVIKEIPQTVSYMGKALGLTEAYLSGSTENIPIVLRNVIKAKSGDLGLVRHALLVAYCPTSLFKGADTYCKELGVHAQPTTQKACSKCWEREYRGEDLNKHRR